MNQNRRLRLLSFFVIGYMLLAFTWWSVLLFTKNRDAFEAKAALMRVGMAAEQLYQDEPSFRQTPAYRQLATDYRKQEWMILGEACVFVLTLLTGLYLINRGYHREMLAAQQRRNFLLSITHELKSPIASIRLVLETLQRHQLQPAQQEKMIRNGLEENDRLHRLVNDLLLSAKLETAYQPIFEPLDFRALILEMCDNLQQKYPDVQLQTFLPPQLSLRGDETGLRSMLSNLLENAVKYSESPPRITLTAEQHPQYLLLEIRDEGRGIPDREKNKVFEKFYRVGNEDTRKTKGTGLGLYIVNEIVKAHQGTIALKNNQPKGTVFQIELPNQTS